jgi:hypothetical protein
MVRLALIVGVLAVVFVIYAFVDCLVTDRLRVRALPKAVWAIVTLIPIFGGILWLTLGKDRSVGAVGAPDDDPAFLRSIAADRADSAASADARIRELEARLAELDHDDHDDDPKK